LKTDLGESFGTKKAKKALKSIAENTISRSGPGKLTQGDSALLDVVKETTASMLSPEEMQAVVDKMRPIPQGDFDADIIQEVYKPEVIIGGEVLSTIPIMDWQEKAKNNEEIQVISRFVANRINRLAANHDPVLKLRLLRYFLFVLTFWKATTKGRGRGTRSVPKRDKLRKAMEPAPEVVIENIRRKFSEGGEMRKYHIDLLTTHLCVFSCLIDNFESDTLDLREDLGLEQRELNKYFSEVGAAIHISKRAGNSHHIAKLALPLKFPKPQQRARRGK
jgi:DNA-directed RNA polymerase I subunit RPA49